MKTWKSSSDIVVVMAIYDLHGPRLRNFRAVLRRMLRSGLPVRIFEQVPVNGDPVNLKAFRGQDLRRWSYYLHNDQFEKSWLMNVAAAQLHRHEWLWFLDTDILPDVDRIRAFVSASDASVIQPVDRIVKLSASETDDLFACGRLVIPGQTRRAIPLMPGPHSIIVRSELMCHGLQFDERFQGYGWEDMDFMQRALCVRDARFRRVQSDAVHLWHPQAPGRAENWDLWRRIRGHAGLGDTIYAMTHLTRVDRVVRWWVSKRGRTCRCTVRRFALNRRFPYRCNALRKGLAKVLPLP